MFNNNQRKLVKIYQDQHGYEPLVKWLESIRDLTIRARISNRLRRLELGNLGDCKSLGQGIYEPRLHFGSGYRVYFGQNDKTIILLYGGTKHSQFKDIKLAQKYWADYKIKSL